MLETEASRPRCAWCLRHPLETDYHDTEWGVPVHEERKLFEYLVLDAAQAGLSWLTVLKKRAGYRAAFAEFDVATVAMYTEDDVVRLLQDTSIIRNRAKIESAITNARAFLKIQREFDTFDAYIWQFTGGRQICNRYATQQEIPATSPEAQAMSADLVRRGFRFVGPTICYAFMQAAGMVNDHTVDCFRHAEVVTLSTA